MSGTGRTAAHELLLGEWACLGILYPEPTHGFAIAARLKPDADIGRVWSMSRALTYRSLDQLAIRGYIAPVGEEPGIAGGNRTILAATSTGRAQLRRWLATPVEHLRDLRSELLLKLILAELCAIDIGPILEQQRARISELVEAITVVPVRPAGAVEAADGAEAVDVVALWRREASQAALRFLDRLAELRGGPPG